MIPIRIKDSTHYLGAPKEWDKDKNGNCVGLAIRQIDNVFQSKWEPTKSELDVLNRGGSILLSIVGGQPPVMLTVEEPPK